ncbi:PucR family transcriptional regulator [Leucobacter insecticola]|uniref:PucR family transcriptional regulator n=1 Tax=Leucobacter insecticola TaxID=2714934 RepID=A0A6G8FGC7_9MICO|nr:PucR family transcriptional regulator ligand-binding domain-containing protein [Leucobacter insecticola]QIM15395.1 PucR family transcriptional regulator [Leucobacter insecticola]
MTIGDLVAIDTLRTDYLAGGAGRDRRVLWAHSCELVEPWLWVGRDELLMTVGFCVPKDAAAQVQFVRELHAAGVAGATIGGRDDALVLSPDMCAEADRLGFPILRTDPSVPWSAISQHVAAAAMSSQTSHVLTLARVYEIAAAARSPRGVVAELAKVLGVQLAIIDRETGVPLLGGFASAAEAGVGELRIRAHRFSERHPAELEIGEAVGDGLNSMVLVHLKRVVEVEVDRMLLEAESRAMEREMALNHLLGSGDGRGAESLLGVDAVRQGYRVLALQEAAVVGVARLTAVRGNNVLLGRSSEHGVMLVPAAELEDVQDLLREMRVRAGASRASEGWGDARGAVAEAVSALVDAQQAGADWAEFSAAQVSLLARSAREAREIVEAVLGSLAEHTLRAATLRTTLFCYLRNDRSWARSAAELGVHRQTLAYRLRQAESMTGRSASRSEDISALWIALQAWEWLGQDPDTAK